MMHASNVLLGLATLLISAPTPVLSGEDHFILGRVTSLAFARMDPIVNPGSVSAHVHNIMGGSCFNASANTNEVQEDCDCSSVIVGDDKSNYWAPALYYQDQQGKLSPILGGNRLYYFTKGKDVKPFPKGLRMISGLAMQRNLSDTRTEGIRISCSHGAQQSFLPNGTSHPDGCGSVTMGIFFPSCGLASGDLDSPDHFSHLAWPQAHPGGGANPFNDANNVYCPDSHPIKYPTIFMEQNYYLSPDQPWHSGNPVVLSNGDELGTTFHADFLEGWTGTVLADTIAQCGDGNGPGDQLQNCAPLKKSLAEWKTWECRLQNKIPNEDVGLYRPLDALPGCNPIWPSDGPATKPACKSADADPTFIYPNAQFVNLEYRMNLPMLFTEPGNLSDYWERKKFIPDLGNAYTSSVKPWGYDSLNGDSLTLSTVAEIEAATNATAAESAANEASGSQVANSTTVKSSATAAASTIGTVALAGHGVETSSSASIHHSSAHTSSHHSSHTSVNQAKSTAHPSNHTASHSISHTTDLSATQSSSHHTPTHSTAEESHSSAHQSGHSNKHHSSAHTTAHVATHSKSHGAATATSKTKHCVAPSHALNSTQLHVSNGTAPAKPSTAKVCSKNNKRTMSEDLKAHVQRRSRRSAHGHGGI